MDDSISALTKIAKSLFQDFPLNPENIQNRKAVTYWENPILTIAFTLSSQVDHLLQNYKEDILRVSTFPEFETISTKPEEQPQIVLHPGGSFRAIPFELISALFSSAVIKIFFHSLPNDQNTFIQTVLEGYKELLNAINGKKVRVFRIHGLGYLQLHQHIQITTPWGVIKSSPSSINHDIIPGMYRLNLPKTTSLFIEERLFPFIFEKSKEPKSIPSPELADPSKALTLLPLSCALASPQENSPIIPLFVWSTWLLPFQTINVFSYTLPPAKINKYFDFSNYISSMEEWSKIVESSHHSSIDIAIRRIISAVTQKNDPSDALIDVVISWENLFGTDTEVSFSVSISLAKLIETDPNKREALYKRIRKIYGVRSRLVHGELVDPTKIQSAYEEAISISILALRKSFNKGQDWLSLNGRQRSEKLLLESPCM